jgi:hypothetical protein
MGTFDIFPAATDFDPLWDFGTLDNESFLSLPLFDAAYPYSLGVGFGEADPTLQDSGMDDSLLPPSMQSTSQFMYPDLPS